MRSGGQRRQAELLTMPRATQPRVAPKEATATSRAPSHESQDQGRTKTCPSSTIHSSADALGFEMYTPTWVSRACSSRGVVHGAEDVALVGTAVGGERGPSGKRGDRVRLLLSPGRSLREMRAQSLTDARPPGQTC